MSNEASLEVLIQIREELAGLNRTRTGLAEAKQEAKSLGTTLKEGVFAGVGMEIARQGIDLLRETLTESAGAALRLANEISDGSEALTISNEAYQVFRLALKDANLDMGRFSMAVTSQTDSLAAARAGVGAQADAYRDLGLSAAEIEKLPTDQRILAVARAALEATDKTRGFAAAGQILGSRGLPQLLSALKQLATEGYDPVAAQARAAGKIMGDDMVEQLDRAQKKIEVFKETTLPLAAGSAIGWVQSLVEKLAAGAGNVINQLQGLDHADLPDAPGAKKTPVAGPPVGPSNVRAETVLAVQLANAEAKASAIQNAALMTETQQRQALLPVLREQETILQNLIKAKYGDLGKELPKDGQVTEEELNRYKERNELEWKLTGIRQQRMSAVDTPLAALWRQLSDTTSLVNNSLASGVGTAISTLGSDIWEAAKGTQAWGDSFRHLGDLAGRILTQIITQMLVVQAINSVLGLFGYGMSGGGGSVVKLGDPTATVGVKAAGGGSFLTHGPTHFTVGDNPGGIELVHVTPISGRGQTTINGQALAMAGGGTALVSGGGANRSGAASIGELHVNFNFATGVAATVRAEVMAMVPQLRAMAVGAINDAGMRNQA